MIKNKEKIIQEKTKKEMKEKEEIIRLTKVYKYFTVGDEKIKAVDGVDVLIRKGDFVAIVGPSGSGKSTMMNLVGALDFATQGDIFFII